MLLRSSTQNFVCLPQIKLDSSGEILEVESIPHTTNTFNNLIIRIQKTKRQTDKQKTDKKTKRIYPPHHQHFKQPHHQITILHLMERDDTDTLDDGRTRINQN